MPAPDFQTLYDLETWLETAFVPAIQGAIDEAEIVATVSSSRNREFQGTPRVELYVVVGAAGTQMAARGQAVPKQTPVNFDFQLTAVIVTTRSLVEGNADVHGPLRGLVRYVLSAGFKAISDSNLPWHQILTMLPIGGSPQLLDEKDNDRSELNYGGQIAIANDAWPNSP